MAGSDGRQAFAALAAAVAQRGAAAPGGFASEKPVLPFAAHLLWLILAFHKLTSFRDKTGAREDNHEPGCVKTRFGIVRCLWQWRESRFRVLISPAAASIRGALLGALQQAVYGRVIIGQHG
jgi:hypothetical protein